MILKAVQANGEAQAEAFKNFETKMALKLKGVENGVHIRLDAQRRKIFRMDKKVDGMADKVGKLAEHVFFIRVLCDIAKLFKLGKK